MFHKYFAGFKAVAGLIMRPELAVGRKLKTQYTVECVRDGQVVWTDKFFNLVVDEGLNDSLDKHLKGSTYTAAWYVGITTGTPTFAAGDTMAGGHAGWTESTVYSNANRPTLTLGTVASKSVDNSASKAVFNINGSGTVGGAFVVANNTKGGATGILYGGGAFTGGNRSVISGDTLNVTVTCTAAAS